MISGFEYRCCRQFFLDVLQVSPKTVRGIQNKINKGEKFVTNVVSTTTRPNKIYINVWKMIEEHWATVPYRPSHCSLQKTKKLYFENPNLIIKKLFDLFKEYFFMITGDPIKMDYRTYNKFFRASSAYAFRRPRTDVCDFRSKCLVLLKVNPCKTKYSLHKLRLQVAGYRSRKNSPHIAPGADPS